MAPISGQVIGLSVTPGQELQANSTLVTVSDTSTVTVSATVDERNISYTKTGMPVNLDQWGTSAFGTVETVSLSSTVNNGVASYPITISADNTDGNLQVTAGVNYQIQASQNDNCLMVPIQAVRTVGAGGRFFRHRGLCAGRQPAGQRAGAALSGRGDPQRLLSRSGGDRYSGYI